MALALAMSVSGHLALIGSLPLGRSELNNRNLLRWPKPNLAEPGRHTGHSPPQADEQRPVRGEVIFSLMCFNWNWVIFWGGFRWL
ncbi:hypothetical protein TRIATDRAFT_256436 [Trichoderma atroviride IMI 206040]|uniref:Uncharacterized protein n=1 Tax=Hypocrea atroviridis (strain ATCC 20476 / IMI 206040) TaxID=452589 RepID=G9NSQ4_HYPAI|nr:uncharacterized protein TRIATDRAFT_256436 [Trichoderma atroviride IMI 206040]EHK46449.1 hypothetical protein TRIATDRAFT_256436 [Trichoderma atroviride IMI 206040]